MADDVSFSVPILVVLSFNRLFLNGGGDYRGGKRKRVKHGYTTER